jgi:hypothetical protein
VNFARDSNYLGTTWAFNTFIQHHTEINNMYWSFVPAWSYAHYMARKNKTSTPEVLFCASGPDVHRLDNSIPQFLRNFESLANWVRLSALLSALSYFEIYLRKAVTLSLLSDPAVRLGKSKAIEGVTWLKKGIKDDSEPLVVSCIKGDWYARINGFRRLFASVPPLMEAKKHELDKLRVLRNKVGHSYGRNLSIDVLETAVPSMERLSEERLKDCLELVFAVAKDTDSFLLGNHIGSFEELLYFHGWRQTLKGTCRLDEGKHLQKALNQLYFGRGLNRSYCDDLVSFYHRC